MNETIQVRARPANAPALALLTVLALVIAPVCAPLCAASSCSSGGLQEQCHEMASMGALGSEHFVAPSKACGSSDFSAVLVKADVRSLLSRGAWSNGAPVLASVSPENGLGSLRPSRAFWRVRRVPLVSSGSTLSNTILRI